MSICIAAIGGGGTKLPEKKIVAVCDRRASSGEFSNEDAALKGRAVSDYWLALYAGNDISPCPQICREVARDLDKLENTVEIVKKSFEEHYQKYLSNMAVARVLGRWRLTMDKFLETGRKRFGADIFDGLCSQIEQIRLQCKFLVCGFDLAGGAHIFTVSNPGCAEDRNPPGYWAIGTGDFAAMSTLGFFKQSVIKEVPHTYHNVWAAKFMAEQASDVGKNSYVWQLGPNGIEQAEFHAEDIVRAAWESGGKPTVTEEAVEHIRKMLHDPMKVVVAVEDLGG